MFGIGLPEMIVILAVALIVVGPDKLPELARSLAKGVNELKSTLNQVKDSLNEETKIVSSVQQDLQQTAGQVKTHLLEDVTRDPNQWKREGETAPASDTAEDNGVIEAESLGPRSWEEETGPVIQEGSLSDQQAELAEGGVDNEAEQHEGEGDEKTSDEDTSAQRPSSVI
ncbi:mttA/Hcf106 family protein [Candidatus Electrothrix communis]|uniref:Sec-independent protein translocase protein TatA n=1 Tax=Candidatus Electrothrix communis TaxID=1859133 RepID=A0A444IVJ2_9BACT|nr:mttA/Hcf106 family protein [Candidatus Electrothrix communis]